MDLLPVWLALGAYLLFLYAMWRRLDWTDEEWREPPEEPGPLPTAPDYVPEEWVSRG